MKKIIATLGILFALSIGAQAQKIKPIYTPTFSNVAIKGYDTVSYFTEKKAVKGNKQFTTKYKGADWHFSSATNLELFKANPEKYAPQYGGYCAYAVSQGYTAKIDPSQWTVLNDKLYLNYNKKINKQWTANRDNFIVDADKNWTGFKFKKVE